MRISELIDRLGQIQSRLGDLEIFTEDPVYGLADGASKAVILGYTLDEITADDE